MGSPPRSGTRGECRTGSDDHRVRRLRRSVVEALARRPHKSPRAIRGGTGQPVVVTLIRAKDLRWWNGHEGVWAWVPLSCSALSVGLRAREKEGLRHWLRSSCQLLRGSPQRGYGYRHSPLMRSPLLRFQTPTAPRRAVGFFGFGGSTSCLAEGITQPTSDWSILLGPILSAVDVVCLKRA
jgi:hypothetical protein